MLRFDAADHTTPPKLFRQAALKADFSPEQLESRQIFVTSPDGTQVPMFVVHKKGIELDGQNPTLLYGYGGSVINLESCACVHAFVGICLCV